MGGASRGQDSIVTIAFDCQRVEPTVSLYDGDGVLNHYRDQTELYRGIYYLFTDASVIRIAPKSKLYERYNLAFHKCDSISEWYSYDTNSLGNDFLIRQAMLDKVKNISFRWKERANLLISTEKRDGGDNQHNLYLVVLPMFPEDTLFSSIDKDVIVDKDNGIVSGSVTLHRTSRIIIDSVYVDGKKANVSYKDHLDRDVPYYGNDGYAQVEIQCPWTRWKKDIRLTVFFKEFNKNGNLMPNQTDVELGFSESTFFEKYWWLLSVIGIVFLILVLTVILLIRRINRGNISGESSYQLRTRIRQLTKENERLTKDLRNAQQQLGNAKNRVEDLQKQASLNTTYQEKIRHLEKEVERLSQPTQAAIDEATFKQKCEQLIMEIERIRESLRGNTAMAEIDGKLRVLEKIVHITKQQHP